jgi:molybdopterin/thiamine biosynthesis adenylyltransferase
MPKWFETDNARFLDEQTRMQQLGFVMDDAAREERQRIEFTGVINDGIADVAIRVICPEGFPYKIPLFIAPDLRLTPATRHISFRTHSICLRTAKPQDWKSTDRIADLVQDANLILRGQHSQDFGDEHVAPDQDLFGTRAADQHVLLPNDLVHPPDASSFRIRASKHFNERVLYAYEVNGRKTSLSLGVPIRTEELLVFRLNQMPLDTIWSLNDLFSAPNPDYEAMLHSYAADRATALAVFRRLGRGRENDYFGVVFEYQTGWYWQFFRVEKLKKQQRRIVCLGTSSFNALESRIARVVDLKRLATKSAVIAGCGAIGGTIAIELATAGLGKLFLNDPDYISAANIVRHECSLANLGMPKPEALRGKIASKNPLTEVVVGGDVFADVEFESKVGEADLVVCAIGDYNVEDYLNRVCARLQKPIIFAYVGVYGAMGHVVRVDTRKRETGCLNCFEKYLEVDRIPKLPGISDLNVAVVELGCNNPSLPALSFDQREVALIAARKALQTFNFQHYPDEDADAIVFYARRLTDQDHGHGLKIEKFKFDSLSKCSICGDVVHQ